MPINLLNIYGVTKSLVAFLNSVCEYPRLHNDHIQEHRAGNSHSRPAVHNQRRLSAQSADVHGPPAQGSDPLHARVRLGYCLSIGLSKG